MTEPGDVVTELGEVPRLWSLAPFEIELEQGWNVCLRPINRDDQDRIQRAYHLISESSRLNRFWEKPLELHPSRAASLADTDPFHHVAWVALNKDDLDFPGFAGASYWRDPEDLSKAEIAFTVGDAWHGRGLATMLFSILWFEGWVTGIRHFYGFCRLENAGLVRWWESLGGTAESGSRGYRLRLDIEEPEAYIHHVAYGMPSHDRESELATWLSEWLSLVDNAKAR